MARKKFLPEHEWKEKKEFVCIDCGGEVYQHIKEPWHFACTGCKYEVFIANPEDPCRKFFLTRKEWEQIKGGKDITPPPAKSSF